MNIEVHIEELILHGVPPGDRHAVGEALTFELTRLFSSRGVPMGLPSTMDTVGAHAPVGTTPLGVRVAGAVYDGLSHG